MHALVEGCAAGEPVGLVDAGDLLEEGAGLVHEAVVLADTHARGVHRKSAREVRVIRPDDHPAVAAARCRVVVVDHLEFGGSLLFPACGSAVTEDLQEQAVRMSRGDPRHLDDADALGELGAEAGVVVVLDRFVAVAHRRLAVPDDRAQRHRPLLDRSDEPAAAHLAGCRRRGTRPGTRRGCRCRRGRPIRARP